MATPTANDKIVRENIHKIQSYLKKMLGFDINEEQAFCYAVHTRCIQIEDTEKAANEVDL